MGEFLTCKSCGGGEFRVIREGEFIYVRCAKCNIYAMVLRGEAVTKLSGEWRAE